MAAPTRCSSAPPGEKWPARILWSAYPFTASRLDLPHFTWSCRALTQFLPHGLGLTRARPIATTRFRHCLWSAYLFPFSHFDLLHLVLLRAHFIPHGLHLTPIRLVSPLLALVIIACLPTLLPRLTSTYSPAGLAARSLSSLLIVCYSHQLDSFSHFWFRHCLGLSLPNVTLP